MLAPVLSFVPIRFVDVVTVTNTTTLSAPQIGYTLVDDPRRSAYSTTGVYEAVKLAYKYSNGEELNTQDVFTDLQHSQVVVPCKVPNACHHNVTRVFSANVLVVKYTCTKDQLEKGFNCSGFDRGGGPLDGTPTGKVVPYQWFIKPANSTPNISLPARPGAQRAICVTFDRSAPAASVTCDLTYHHATADVTWNSNGLTCWVSDVSRLSTQQPYGSGPEEEHINDRMNELGIALTNAYAHVIDANLLFRDVNSDPQRPEKVVGAIYGAASLIRTLFIPVDPPVGNKTIVYSDYTRRTGFKRLPLRVISLMYGVLALLSYVSFLGFEIFSDLPERFWHVW